MLRPVRKDEALLADIWATHVDPWDFCLWWLGQSGFLFKTSTGCLLVDPYLSDSLTQKYDGTDRPHVRMMDRCVDPARLGFVDAVLSTHGHTDHFDRETLRAIATAAGRVAPLTVGLPASNLARGQEMLGDLDVRLVPLEAGQASLVRGFAVVPVPAAHTELECDELGRHLFLGYVLQLGNWRLYHSGDTVWNEMVVSAAARAAPHVALLPINGHDPSRGVAGNLAGPEAAAFAARLGVALAIPHHYDMFEFNTASPGSFTEACAQLGVTARVLTYGGHFHSRELPH